MIRIPLTCSEAQAIEFCGGRFGWSDFLSSYVVYTEEEKECECHWSKHYYRKEWPEDILLEHDEVLKLSEAMAEDDSFLPLLAEDCGLYKRLRELELRVISGTLYELSE